MLGALGKLFESLIRQVEAGEKTADEAIAAARDAGATLSKLTDDALAKLEADLPEAG